MRDASCVERLPEVQVDRLLVAARNTIVEVPFFWVITTTDRGVANARVVKAQANGAGEDFWTRWFLTPRVGRKAADIRRSGLVTLAYQHSSGEAYVALSGRAELIDDHAEVDIRFGGSPHDDPERLVSSSLIAVRVFANHLELHVRGITAEPWGHGRTLLDRSAEGNWHLAD